MDEAAYYNDIDGYCCRWLRNLAAGGGIPGGLMDDRDIADINARELWEYRHVHLFAGIGGWPLALRLAGWPATQAVWTASCPCQPLSCAGKRRGEADERHLWPELHRLISECRPPVIFSEQVASKDGIEWLDGISLDMEELGYAVGSADLPAASVGAPHIRQRLFWVAHRLGAGLAGRQEQPARPERPAAERGGGAGRLAAEQTQAGQWWDGFAVVHCLDGKSRRVPESGLCPLVDGLPRSVGPGGTRSERLGLVAAKANRVGRLRGYGNALVPQVAAVFVRAVMEVLGFSTEVRHEYY